jgi:hypothetical protein
MPHADVPCVAGPDRHPPGCSRWQHPRQQRQQSPARVRTDTQVGVCSVRKHRRTLADGHERACKSDASLGRVRAVNEGTNSVDVVGWAQVALAVVAIIASIVLFSLQKPRRAIGFAVIHDRAIITAPKSVQLEVNYGGKTVRSPRLTVLRLFNATREPIPAADWEGALTLRLPGRRILSAELTGNRPHSFRPRFSLADQDKIEIEPCLMNGWDLAEIQILSDGKGGPVLAEGRIAGVSDLSSFKVPRDSWGRVWKHSRADLVTFVIFGLILSGFGALVYFSNRSDLSARLLGLALMLYSALIYPLQIARFHRRNLLLTRVNSFPMPDEES